jgi:hypothetical protein
MINDDQWWLILVLRWLMIIFKMTNDDWYWFHIVIQISTLGFHQYWLVVLTILINISQYQWEGLFQPSLIIIQKISLLVGGCPTPLKIDGVKVSWDDDIPNWMESHKIHVPNHQPDGIPPDMAIVVEKWRWTTGWNGVLFSNPNQLSDHFR